MLCNLCNTNHEKLCKAHLIPESFYRFMYPDSKIVGTPLRIVLHDSEHAHKSVIGLYDNNILCSNCDNFLGKLDDYGKEILLDKEPEKVYANSGNEIFSINNVDIKKLSLFFLSVLWRCSISKRKELSEVCIGKKFENKIRDLLFLDKETVDDFSIVITRYRYLNDNYKKLLFLPKPLKIEGLNYYNVYFPNGYKILIKVDRRPQLRELEALTLKVGKQTHVICYDWFDNSDEYEKTSLKVKAIGGNAIRK